MELPKDANGRDALNGRYVRWAKVWHGHSGGTTYCGRRIPGTAIFSWAVSTKLIACGKCFDV